MYANEKTSESLECLFGFFSFSYAGHHLSRPHPTHIAVIPSRVLSSGALSELI